MGTPSSKLKIIIGGSSAQAEAAFHSAKVAAEDSFRSIGLAAAGAAVSVTAVGAAVIATSAEFERYNAQLETITGSSAAAAQSMDFITQFTKKTPFELSQVTDAFVKLKAFGIDPVANDALRTLGDTAAAMGKPLSQGVEALADAMTGEFERLKEFGIKAKVTGDQVQFAYNQNGEQMVAVADKTSSAMIQKTLQGIFNDKYTGGMDKLSHTWGGMTSNLSDSWTIFQKQIGDAGSFNAAKGGLELLLGEIGKNDTEIKALAKDISDGLITSMELATTAGALVAKGFVAMQAPMNTVRLVIDSLALGAVQGFDKMLAGLMTFYGALSNLPGTLGKPYAEARRNIAAFRHELEPLDKAIRETGNESLKTFLDSSVEIEKSWAKIDSKAQRVFTGLENARDTPAPLPPVADVASSAPSTASSEDPAVAKARIDAQKIIDIHSARFAEIQALGTVAFGSEQERLLAQSGVEDAKLLAEQARIEQAAVLQGAKGEQLAAIQDYYDQLRIDKSQATADKIGAIDKAASDAKNKLDKLKHQQQFQAADQFFGDIAGLMNSGSRKAFEIGKVAAIAQAGVNGISASIAAWDKGMQVGGLPVAVAMTAASVVKTAVMISKLQSAHFGGAAASVSAGGASFASGGNGSTVATAPHAFNPSFVQRPATQAYARPQLQIVQHINAPGATAGTAQVVQQAAALGAQQAVAHVANDFQTNGQLRQSLAV